MAQLDRGRRTHDRPDSERPGTDPHESGFAAVDRYAWNVGDLPRMALPPCHVLFQFYVAAGRLSCQLYQRSADAFLGVPFNIASYALLTLMMAHVTGLQPASLSTPSATRTCTRIIWSRRKTQLQREPRPLPSAALNPEVQSVFDFRYEDLRLENYDPHPHIAAPVAV